MRSLPAAMLGLVCLFSSNLVLAQRWSIELYDIHIDNDDPTLDRTRAEAVEFLPDGKTIVTAGWFYLGVEQSSHSEVAFRSIKDGSLTKTLIGKARSYSVRADSLACSPDGKYIAAAGSTKTPEWIVDVFDVSASKHTHTLRGEASFISGLRFSPKRTTLVVAHENGIVNSWNPETGEKSDRFAGNGQGIESLVFSPDCRFLAVGNDDGSVSFRDSETGKEVGNLAAQDPLVTVEAIAISPDGKFLATGGMPMNQKPSAIALWELTKKDNSRKVTGTLKAKLQGHERYTYSLVFSPDSKLLASASQDETVRLWDVGSAKQLKAITKHTDFAYDAAFSPDGEFLATLGRDSLKLWSVKELRNAK